MTLKDPNIYNTLVVLDYSNCTVNYYTIKVDEITENVIRNLGHHPSNCSWMFCDPGNLTIIDKRL